VKIFKSKAALKNWREHIPSITKIGIVPTMGNLHLGHISLIKKSVEDNQITVITIFVNPKQFGPNEDFKNYPRTLEADLNLIKTEVLTQKEIIVFCPESIEEMYVPGFDTQVTVGKLTAPLCGPSRPIHFNGVTTVVFKIFQLTRPHRAYFGLKDYQQFKVIEKMTIDLDLDIELIGMPIIREESGLAMSSRNAYLSSDEKNQALILTKNINELKNAYPQSENLRKQILQDTRYEYLEILDGDTLEIITEKSKKVVIAGALKIGKTRLIDNMVFNLC